jgi:hypothetical protein
LPVFHLQTDRPFAGPAATDLKFDDRTDVVTGFMVQPAWG